MLTSLKINDAKWKKLLLHNLCVKSLECHQRCFKDCTSNNDLYNTTDSGWGKRNFFFLLQNTRQSHITRILWFIAFCHFLNLSATKSVFLCKIGVILWNTFKLKNPSEDITFFQNIWIQPNEMLFLKVPVTSRTPWNYLVNYL